MIKFLRPANREESAKFFAESPQNLSLMINDANGDYVSRRDYDQVVRKYRELLYDVEETLETLQSKIHGLKEETYLDLPIKI